MKNFNLGFTRLSEGQEFRNRKLITFFLNIPVSKRILSQFNPDHALTYVILCKWPLFLRFYHLKLRMYAFRYFSMHDVYWIRYDFI